MRILLASSEIVPFASTGGLGEVARALPEALTALGAEVISVMPMYRRVIEGGHALRDTGIRLKIPLGFRVHAAEIWQHDGPPTTYFIRRDEYFDRRELYSLPERDYTDNFERFVFYQKAVVALIDHLAMKPDAVHAHDWTGGLIPWFLRYGINGMGREGRERSVFTIHNLAYQGIYPGAEFSLTNLPFSCFSIDSMEFYGNLNCMKAGLTGAGALTTVSQTYAREIQTPEFGCGLDGVLRSRAGQLTGIQNGVNYDAWDPQRDRRLAATFSPDDLSGKTVCRDALLKKYHLQPAGPDTVVVGMVSRLVEQKGIDLLSRIMPDLMKRDIRFLLLGSGQQEYQAMCLDWAHQWPVRFHVTIGYDSRASHAILSGADVILMPSKVEPCGLTQLYAMRYGALPVVHATGGLNDTVQEISASGDTGNGCRFDLYEPEEFLKAIDRALAFIRKPERFSVLRARIMGEDHSWTISAKKYLDIYRQKT